MIKFLLLLLLVLHSNFSTGQKLKIESSRKELLVGLSNSFKFSLDMESDSVAIRTSQGTSERSDSVIRLIPETSGRDSVFFVFYDKTKRIYKDTVSFQVVKIDVFPTIGSGRPPSKVTSSLIKKLGQVFFMIDLNGHWEAFNIKSYRFSILRNGIVLFSRVQGGRLSDELMKKLEILLTGDQIIISDVEAEATYDRWVNCLPGIFEIE